MLILAIITIVTALCLLGVVVAWRYRKSFLKWWYRRHRETPRYPVVLVHGVLGFDAILVGNRRVPYFRDIAEALEARGITVYIPRMPAAAAIAKRAQVLADYIRALAVDKVNLIAHSMGGLDARYAIAHLGLAARVASLTTIGTPHRGTAIADAGTGMADKLMLRRLLGYAGIEIDAFYEMKTDVMAQFNEETPDAPGVQYLSVVAAMDKERPFARKLLYASHQYLVNRDGSNDGLVATSSQRRGDVIAEIVADHWQQIGWGGAEHVAPVYIDIVDELRDRGC